MSAITVTHYTTADEVEYATEADLLIPDETTCTDCATPVGIYLAVNPETSADDTKWRGVVIVDIEPAPGHESERVYLCEDCAATPILAALHRAGQSETIGAW
jgi:anaerobic selenocysteine-containing dehydrogenase